MKTSVAIGMCLAYIEVTLPAILNEFKNSPLSFINFAQENGFDKEKI